jgi:hypothetical protein
MIPQIGQTVKCIFRNGTLIEGIVEEWGNQAILRSLTDESILIIPHPAQDLIIIKIVALKKQSTSETADIEQKSSEHIQQPIKNKLEEAQQTTDPELKNKSIKELQNLVIQQEKLMISKKMQDHYAGGNPKVSYGSQINLIRKK